MTLATVASDLRPSTRIVLVKGYDERGITWYTNYDSRKGRELAGNPYAALQFHWVELERVVRIEGRGREGPPRTKRRLLQQPPARFPHRRLGQPAKRGDRRPLACWWPTRRSTARNFLLSPRARRTGAATAWCRTNWQFWQGRKSRLHDRLRYTLQENGDWLRERLAP
jgi:pyridoxamine 5'-phosphate oxidase